MPLKDKEKRREYDRRRYRKRKQKGLCRRCGKPAVPRYTLCAWCSYKGEIDAKDYRARNRGRAIEKNREIRKKRLEENRCYRCGTPLMEEENKYCINCSMNIQRQYPGVRRRREINYKAVAGKS